MEKELSALAGLAASDSALTRYGFAALLKVFVGFAVAGIVLTFGGMFYSLSYNLGEWSSFVLRPVATLFYLVAINRGIDATRTLRRLDRIDSFEKETKSRIKELRTRMESEPKPNKADAGDG